LSDPVRLLRVGFTSPKDFEREYASNLVNAGVFVATRESFSLRDPVEVEVALEFAGRSLRLPGEVVHILPAEMAAAGGTPGVAVQFTEVAHVVRERLAPLIEASGSFQAEPHDTGQRSAPRVPARVPVQLTGRHGPVEGRTHNLSLSGVLVSLPRTDIAVGETLELCLTHRGNSRSMKVPARVVREAPSDEGVSVLGLQFQPVAARRADFERFVEEIQAAEHSRRLGGISGSLAELGPQSLLQMFGSSAEEGTLTLIQGELEGSIGFQRGLLRYARLGAATGMKALTRMLAWRQGGFEFHAHLEALVLHEAPLPLEAAVLEAVRQLDEVQRIDARRFPPDARLRLADPEAMAGDGPSKVEEAVADLARAGFSVRRIVEVIPEPDPEILAAIASLLDRGVVTCGD
jgi:Tfp pilus assembly protein PilZ